MGNDGLLTGAPTGFAVMFVVVLILIACGFVLTVVGAVRRAQVSRREGLDPFAADIQMTGALRRSALLAPTQPAAGEDEREGARQDERTVAERLAEVDALHAAGTIDAAERAAARERILRDV
ncbi:MAG: hypothetical protein ACTHQ3_21075 [Motilibacteraceae bacterium]